MVACIRALTTSLRLQHEQQHSPPPGMELQRLAYSIAALTAQLCHALALSASWQPSQSAILIDMARTAGPRFVVWADITLVLVLYAETIQQQGHLPGVDASAGSSSSSGSRTAAAAASAAAAVASASSSTGHGSDRPAQWQQVQDECEHVPASHKQLLGCLGSAHRRQCGLQL